MEGTVENDPGEDQSSSLPARFLLFIDFISTAVISATEIKIAPIKYNSAILKPAFGKIVTCTIGAQV